ncbi:hypothetical protein KUV26_01175 [Leisingera daeponensis]|uniref:Uncharacterized protein n=1 Tax=Leisingera daeponensis TaxID=405746 RepID=A0ABS7NBA4_9RHOB|nr:hypothetical protein [Leisingera daeponensis]MBY6138039.1 hypothetical protein [Leisingera daeponensis]
MKGTKQIMGQAARAPRITKTAALLVAFGLSVPVFLVLTLIEALFF